LIDREKYYFWKQTLPMLDSLESKLTKILDPYDGSRGDCYKLAFFIVLGVCATTMLALIALVFLRISATPPKYGPISTTNVAPTTL